MSAQVFWGVRFKESEGELAERAMRDIAREVAGRMRRFGLEEAFAEGAVSDGDMQDSCEGDRGNEMKVGASGNHDVSRGYPKSRLDLIRYKEAPSPATASMEGTARVGDTKGRGIDAMQSNHSRTGSTHDSTVDDLVLGVPGVGVNDSTRSVAASSQGQYEATDNTAALLRAAVELRPSADAALTVESLLHPPDDAGADSAGLGAGVSLLDRVREPSRFGLQGRRIGVVIKRRRPDAKMPWKSLGHGECEDFSRTRMLPHPTGSAAAIGDAAVELLRGLGLAPHELRGLSVKVEALHRPWRDHSETVGGALRRHFQRMRPALPGCGPPDEAAAGPIHGGGIACLVSEDGMEGIDGGGDDGYCEVNGEG